MERRKESGLMSDDVTTALLGRILREGEGVDVLEILAERLMPTDLQSLLIEVYRRRAARQTPARLLEQYEQNRFVRPSPADPRALLAFDRLAFARAAPAFEPVELAPVCPLGTTSAVATVSQNKAVATSRNTEVVADSTNVLALECAVRRRGHLSSPGEKSRRVRLCASHRLVRAQNFGPPGALAHFRLFGLCSAGRDEGSHRFEVEELAEHLGFYLRLLAALRDEEGYAVSGPRVALTDLGGLPEERLRTEVAEPLAARFPGVPVGFAPERITGRGYYDGACFHLYATDPAGHELLLVDGGFTTWTQQLLSNQKERLLISGIGSERVCSAFRTLSLPG
jgi:hypothetical protein